MDDLAFTGQNLKKRRHATDAVERTGRAPRPQG